MAANLAVERPKKSRNEEVMQSPREATRSGTSYFYISENVDSLNYTSITNLLEFERQKTQTYGSLTLEDCLRLMMFVITGLLSAFIGVFLEISIEKIGHWKFQVINEFVREQFEEDSYNLVTIAAVRFAGVAVPVMLGTALVVYLAPYASGGGVSQCIAYLNGIRVPKVLNLRGIIVRAISTVCTCVSGLAGGKEGPAIFLGTASGGSLPSLFPWLNLRSDVERRDLAAAGFGSGIAVVFGAPIGGLLLALEEGLSYWEIGLMWKMYLCCVVAYAVGSIVFSLFLGVEVKLNNQDLTAFGEISSSITRYELFEIAAYSVMAVLGGLLGALVIRIHVYIYLGCKRFINTKTKKMAASFVVSCIHTIIMIVCIRGVRICSKLTEEKLQKLQNDTVKRHIHQLYCNEDEQSDMSLLFQQTQADIMRTFLGNDPLHKSSLFLFVVIYFLLICMTMGLSISYGLFIPQIIFGSAWGRLFGSILKDALPNAEWAKPAKYAYIGAVAQLSGTVGKTFSILVIMMEASGSLAFSFPIMVVVGITKVVVTFFVVPIYQTQMLLAGLPFLYTKPPPLSLQVLTSRVMSQGPLVTLTPAPNVMTIINVIKTTNHNGFPVIDPANSDNLLGLILRQQLLILLKHKAYKFPPPSDGKQMLESLKLYQKQARKRLNEQEIVGSVESNDYNTKLDLSPYYDAFPYTVNETTPAVKAYILFRNMAIRHLVVITKHNQPVGMLTRKDLAKFHTYENFFRLGVIEMIVT